MFTNHTDYNPLDIIKGNKIIKQLKSQQNLSKEEKKELYRKLIYIHDGLTNQLDDIIREKGLKLLKKGTNFTIDIYSNLDILKVINLNSKKRSKSSDQYEREREIITQINAFHDNILEIMFNNFINTLDYT